MQKTLLFLLTISLFTACQQAVPTTYDNSRRTSTVQFAVQAKIRLENSIGKDLMSNFFQEASLLPAETPYKARLVDDKQVVSNLENAATQGKNALIDWVVMELRYDDINMKRVLQTRSGFVQADGDIVGLDGISPIVFNVVAGNYYVSVKHRNHLGIRTLNKFNTEYKSISLDFTNGTVPLNGSFNVVAKSGYFTMISGDANGDGSIDAEDIALFEQENGVWNEYSAGGDFNLDCSVDSSDLGLFNEKNGIYEEVE